MLTQRICFIGAGSITEALVAGLLSKKLTTKDRIAVINKADQDKLRELCVRYGVSSPSEKAEVVEQAHIVVLAVKPRDVYDALTAWGPHLKADRHVLVSVVAGATTAYLESFLEEGVPVIRSMPNTSCFVGRSATGMAPGRWADADDVQMAEQLFRAIGTVVTVGEHLLDAVTGLSGSGPAYIYYMVEALEKAGIEAGLEREIARQLTVQTLLGAAEMLVKTKEEPALLREKITSPGGTTQAGLDVLRSHHFDTTVREAVFRARDRAKQMGVELSKTMAVKS